MNTNVHQTDCCDMEYDENKMNWYFISCYSLEIITDDGDWQIILFCTVEHRIWPPDIDMNFDEAKIRKSVEMIP